MLCNEKLSFIIPAYNEEGNIIEFIEYLDGFIKDYVKKYEFIIINDGSIDNTDSLVRKIIHIYPICYIKFSRNFGKEAALSAGLDMASGDIVILVDADFQHPVNLIIEMLTLWQQGYDMVYGVIENRQHESFFKRIGVGIFYKVININRANKFVIPKNAGDFRLMDKKVVNALKRLPERRRFMKGLYAWAGFKSIALPFKPSERHTGISSFQLGGLLSLAAIGITSFSSVPLRLSAIAGFIISICAVIYALFITCDTLIFGNAVAGWSTLAVGLMFFSGIQLVMLGIIGEYLSQLYEEIKQRPLYIIEEMIKQNS